LKRPDVWPVADVAGRLGVALEPESVEGFASWLDTLVEWNARLDLTAARTVNELVDLMVADALVLAPHVAQGASLVDVGTGAGAPGLALAILRPDLKVTLVEPLTKRISFLRTVLGKIGRTDVTLVRARADDVHASFDVAVSRATLGPERWLAAGLALADNVWVLLAKEEAPSHGGAAIVSDLTYQWPLTEVARRMVAYQRLPGR
jgi:16S rRNA (guanine527-N7)-methyltransferase